MTIHGSKKGSSKPRQPIIAPDSAQSKTYINILYGLGEGEIAGLADGYKSVYLDDTPLQNDNGEFNFPNIKVDFRSGTNDQTYIDGFPDVSSETAVNVELKHGTPFVKAFNNLDLDALRIRLKWGALRSQNADNGDVGGVKIDYAIDIKTDNGGWVQSLTTSINAKTSNNYERSHRIDLPTATQGWQVRVRRITPNSTSDFVSDKMYVSAITEVIDLKLRYPNTALLGLRYDAESFNNVAKMSARCRGLIIKVPTNYDPETRTYTGLWDGTFKRAYTNNPAWVYYDLCTAERYGLGGRLTESMIDKWSLYRLAQYCDEMVDDGMGGQEPRFTVNVYIQSAEGAFEVLSKLAGVFRAISYWDGNSIVVDADIPQDSMYSFSRANVIDGVFEYSGTRARDRHTVAKVAWSNPANHFKTEYEYVRDEKAIAKFGVRVADISAWGCTSKGQAQRAGLWALKSEQLETRMVTFKVGLDGYIPTPAKVIEISDELFAGRANGGRVLAINTKKTVITLDRPIAANVGDTLVINGDDGVSQRRLIKSINGDKVTVTKSFTNISVENVWVLDSADLATMKFRVLSVTADDNHQFTITAVQYNPAKYDAIDTGAYIDERPISVINPTVQAPTKSVNLSSYTQVNQGVNVTTLVISWEQVTGAVKYAVEWRKDNGNWQALPATGTNSIEISGVYAGQYEAKVTAISAFGQASLATHSNLTEIQGKQSKPTKLAKLTVQGVLFGMELSWLFGAKSEDTNFTEIQVSPDGRSNITTLGTFAYPTNKHEITGLQGNLTQFYRARIVDKLGNTSDWTAWVKGVTSAQADKVLNLISGQISQSHLDQSLRTPIAKIGGLESGLNGIKGQIPTLQSAISTINGQLPTLNTKIATAERHLQTTQNTLQTAVANITTERNRINTAIRDIGALQSANTAKTQEIANLVQTVGNHTSSIRELGVTTGDLSQKYTQLKTATDNATSEIMAIKQTQAGQATSIEQMNSKFGWQTLTTATDLNMLTTQGNYFIIGARTNSPVNAWTYVTVDVPRADRITQTAWADNAPNTTYRRTRAGTTWTAWEKMATGAELNTKASSADVQTLRQTVADNNSALGRQISQITANVTNAQNKADTADVKATQAKADIIAEQKARADGDGSLARQMSALDSKFTNADNAIKASVAQAQQTATNAHQALATAQNQLNAKIDEISVGGRNYLEDTMSFSRNKWYHHSHKDEIGKARFIKNPNGIQIIGSIANRWKEVFVRGRPAHSNTTRTTDSDVLAQLKIGQTYTMSFEAKANVANETLLFFWREYRTTNGTTDKRLKSSGNKDTLTCRLSTQYQRFVKTFTLHTFATNVELKDHILMYFSYEGNQAVHIRNMKLELGNQPTDYTPAPEDTQSQLDEKASTATLDEFKQAQATKDAATAQRIVALDTAYKLADTTLTARLASEEQTRASANAALTQRLDSLQSTVNGNKASIDNQLHTLSDKDKAQATKLSQLESSLGKKASAAALNNLTTKVSQVEGRINAEASKYSTLQTTVGQHTASIQMVMQSVDGLKSQWTMKVESGGVVAGIGLASSNGKSRFAIRADVLDVVSPDGTKRPLFSVLTTPQTINGVSVPKGVYLDSAYIANGSIDIAKINKASIQSLSALSANIGHFKSAETGARLEIKDSVLLVYDANNVLRVRLGLW